MEIEVYQYPCVTRSRRTSDVATRTTLVSPLASSSRPGLRVGLATLRDHRRADRSIQREGDRMTRVEIDGLRLASLNAREHWSAKQRRVRDERAWSRVAIRAAGIRAIGPDETACIVIVRRGATRPRRRQSSGRVQARPRRRPTRSASTTRIRVSRGSAIKLPRRPTALRSR